MAYLTVTELKSYINELTGGVQTSFTGAEDAVLQTFIDEAVAEVERSTRRTFEAANGTRTYTPEDVTDDTLYLDADLMSVTTLKNGDGSTISAGSYTLQPENWMPKTKIKLKATATWQWATDGRIEVTGLWGFSTIPPADVKRIVKRLAWFYWMKRTATGETSVAGDNVAVIPAEHPADIQRALERYQRKVIR